MKIFIKSYFFCNQRNILAIDLHKFNLDYGNNFDDNDPDTIIHVRLLAWWIKFEKPKALKKGISEE